MRYFAGIILSGAGLLFSWFAPTAEVDRATTGIERLREMPLEYRRQLAAELDRFDLLPTSEQKLIRSLDGQLAELSAEEQSRLRTTMRNYFRWEQSLNAEQRESLRSAPPSRRMELVREFRAQQTSQELTSTDLDLEPGSIWSRSATFNPLPIIEAAYLVKAWISLDEQGRDRIERLPSLEDRMEALRELSADADHRGNFGQVEEWENRILSRMPAPLRQRFEGQDAERYPFRFDPRSRASPARKSQNRLRLLRSMESWLIQEFGDEIPTVATPQLLSFESSLPVWLRETFDPLPPEAALHRLTILYHLVLNDQDLPAPAPMPPRNQEPPPGRPIRPKPPANLSPF